MTLDDEIKEKILQLSDSLLI
ncbi:TPA_asm: type IV secretion protein Rhs, partial [Salmonella enterica]|nr:type IV secretion protein Rhs [Salmonella enterica]HAE2446562.1 type IV secretion protein Rhs [Salmonella enterica]HAE5830766.1 type IV secretion protein Rhs [Salmonella enterica]